MSHIHIMVVQLYLPILNIIKISLFIFNVNHSISYYLITGLGLLLIFNTNKMIIKQILIELILKLKFLILIILSYNNINVLDFFENNDIDEEKSNIINTAGTIGIDDKTNANIINNIEKEERSNTNILKKEHQQVFSKIEELGEEENNINLKSDNLNTNYSNLEKNKINDEYDNIKNIGIATILSAGASFSTKVSSTVPKIAVLGSTAAFAGTWAKLTDNYKYNVLENYDDFINNRPPSPGHGKFNWIDINSFKWVNKIQYIIDNFDNFDSDTKFILCAISFIFIALVYIIYIYGFIVSPIVFDLIKNYLPLKFRTFIEKIYLFNRKFNIPFIIFSFIFTLLCLFLAIFSLWSIIYFKKII